MAKKQGHSHWQRRDKKVPEVSHGGEATRAYGGGILMTTLLQTHCSVSRWTNFRREAYLPQTDGATVNCCTVVRKVSLENARNKRMTLKVFQGHWKWRDSIGHMSLPNSRLVSILHRVRYNSTFTLCFTACDLEKSFSFDTTVAITGNVRFPIM